MKEKNIVQEKKTVLKVNKGDANRWASLMQSLGNKELPKLVKRYEALELGSLKKDILLDLQSDPEGYIIKELKKKFLEGKVPELLHSSLIATMQTKIDDFCREFANFKGRLEDLKHTIVGSSLQNWGSLTLENLPMKDDEVVITPEYLQSVIDVNFTTYIEPEQEKLYNDLAALSKQMQKVFKDWHKETGLDIYQFKDDLLEFDLFEGSVSPNVDNVIWFLSFVKEDIPG